MSSFKNIFLTLFCLFFLGCFSDIPKEQGSTVQVGDKKFYVEVADTLEKQKQGLMNREFLAKDEGMLFVYKEEADRKFWMKNTFISLVIVWISKDFEVLDIQKAFPCEEEMCKVYSSDRKAKYVLEVGKFEGRIGDIVEINLR